MMGIPGHLISNMGAARIPYVSGPFVQGDGALGYSCVAPWHQNHGVVAGFAGPSMSDALLVRDGGNSDPSGCTHAMAPR